MKGVHFCLILDTISSLLFPPASSLIVYFLFAFLDCCRPPPPIFFPCFFCLILPLHLSYRDLENSSERRRPQTSHYSVLKRNFLSEVSSKTTGHHLIFNAAPCLCRLTLHLQCSKALRCHKSALMYLKLICILMKDFICGH